MNWRNVGCPVAGAEYEYNSGPDLGDLAKQWIREGHYNVTEAIDTEYDSEDAVPFAKALHALAQVPVGQLEGSDALAEVLRLARQVDDNVYDRLIDMAADWGGDE
jgi:hypothetical protein